MASVFVIYKYIILLLFILYLFILLIVYFIIIIFFFHIVGHVDIYVYVVLLTVACCRVLVSDLKSSCAFPYASRAYWRVAAETCLVVCNLLLNVVEHI
jgi:hypothetical protein